MYPNPQDALPIPPRPSLEQYKKRAKDLVKACNSGDPTAIRVWATRWIEALGRLHGKTETRRIDQVEQFARTKLAADEARCTLADAQFVIARASGFESWPRMARHIEILARANSTESAFEAAADAIVAGAEVDAEADVYGGGATTLGLAATSEHPRAAGVQNDLIDVLLGAGARMDLPRGGNKHPMVNACLHNGCPEAADYLVTRGAPLDLEGAAGVGRLDAVQRLVSDATEAERRSGFALACAYGHAAVVEFLLDLGLEVGARLTLVGWGHTGLHVAALRAHVDVVRVLLGRGALVNVKDETWGTPPLVWALHGSSEETAPPERYYAVVRLLVAAGALVDAKLLEDGRVRGDPEMREALTGR